MPTAVLVRLQCGAHGYRGWSVRGSCVAAMTILANGRSGPLPIIFDPHRATGPTCLWRFRFAVTDARPES